MDLFSWNWLRCPKVYYVEFQYGMAGWPIRCQKRRFHRGLCD